MKSNLQKTVSVCFILSKTCKLFILFFKNNSRTHGVYIP